MSDFVVLQKKEPDSENPKTNACELVRSAGGSDQCGRAKLSRTESMKIIKLFATVLGVDTTFLFDRLSDFYTKEKEKKKSTVEIVAIATEEK